MADAAPVRTRSPKPNDLLVCPQCGRELLSVPEVSLRYELRVIKACGYVSSPPLFPSEVRTRYFCPHYDPALSQLRIRPSHC